MSATPRIMLIGAGAMGSRHARIVSQSGIATLGLVVDPRRDVGSLLADQCGAEWAPTFDTLDSFDAVIIAAATEAHHELALRVIADGKPLFVEKPLSDSMAASLAVVRASEDKASPLMCGFVERFNPAVVAARSMTDAPLHITATRHSPYASRIRTGVAWDLLIHDVDLVLNLMGEEPIDVRGAVGRFDPRSVSEDVAEGTLVFDGGQLGHVSASRVSHRKVRSLAVHELNKLIEVDLLRRNVTVYRNVADRPADAEGRGYRQETVIEIPEIVSTAEPLAAQFAHFAALIDGRIDADAERASIIGSHRVIDRLLTGTT